MQTKLIVYGDRNWNLITGIENLKGVWVTAEELGTHLEYEDSPGDAVNKIYHRHQKAFKPKIDTWTVNLTVQGQARKVRIYSERGSLKVVRYSNTEVSDEIMDHVFDVFLQAKREEASYDLAAQQLIDRYVMPSPNEWQKIFPDQLGKAIFQMYGLGEYVAGISHPVLSMFYSFYVYEAAPPGVYEKLLKNNPGEAGKREYKHHQFLSSDAKDWLRTHIAQVQALIRGSSYNSEIFKATFKNAFPDSRYQALIEKTSREISRYLALQICFEF